MKHAIKRHPVLAAGFGLAVVLCGFFALRLTMMALFWQPAPKAPLAGWMTVAYVAQMHSLPREAVAAAIGIAPGSYPRQSLARIAEARSEPLEAILARIEAALATARADD